MSQNNLTRGIAHPSFALGEAGMVPIPDRPGSGVGIDLDFVTGHRVN